MQPVVYFNTEGGDHCVEAACANHAGVWVYLFF